MISGISFRNFLVVMAVLPYTASAFNPANMPKFPVASTSSEPTDGGLKAATLDNVGDGEDIWSSVTQMIHSKIEEQGGDSLSEEATDEIIATAVAGVVGTVVGSPLMVGAALGYAGSQMLQGEKGEKAREAIGQASKEVMSQANSAIDFTKKELENEKDLSKVSAKVLLAIQDKAGEMQKDFEAAPSKMVEQIPGLLASKMKENILSSVGSIEPKQSFNKFMAFMESEEVQKMKSGAVKALKDGLESDELKALQSKAQKAVHDGIDTAKSKIIKA